MNFSAYKNNAKLQFGEHFHPYLDAVWFTKINDHRSF